MTIVELLSQLRNLDIYIWVDEGRLRINAPDGVLTPKMRTELSARKSEIILFLEQAEAGKRLTTETIPPAGRQENLPLSFAQQRVWILDQLQMAAFTNMTAAVRISGDLNVPLLEKSLNEVVRRHAILRTSFVVKDGYPVQTILSGLEVSIPIRDLRGLSKAEQETTVHQDMFLAALRAFDLSQPPLFELILFRLDTHTYDLSLNFHHIISDAWSQSVLVQELVAYYSAFQEGRLPSLPEPSVQYADFACWQQQSLQSARFKDSLAYWKQKLVGPLPVLEMLSAQTQSSTQPHKAVKQVLTLDAALARALEHLSQQEGTTLFTVLLAAFKTLLYRCIGQTDIVVGTPVFDRQRSEVQHLIGLFLNTLVLRTDLSGNPPFTEMLGRVHQTVREAFVHKDVPFERLVEEIQPERSLVRNPLFQVTFVMQNVPTASIEIPGLALTPIPLETPQAAPPDLLGMNIQDTPAGIVCELESKAGLLNQTLLEQFQTLLQGIVKNPRQRLSDLPLLTKAEEDHILYKQISRGVIKSQPAECIHMAFERQAAETPDAVALVVGEEQLTYQELNQRANRVAHYLRSVKLETEALVGIYMERSLDMIISILGVLKAGGAYLPLDTVYPPDRLAFVLQDSQAPVLLTQHALREKLPALDLHIICIDTEWDRIAQEKTSNPASSVVPDNLAYSIYTSGSTGRPKGVLIPHKQVTRLFQATNDWFRFGTQDVWSFFHSHAFDFSVWEIFGALLYGGKLITVPYWVSRSPDDLYTLLCESCVTVLNQTPSAFRQLTWGIKNRNLPPTRDLSLRFVIFGGEALDLSDLPLWYTWYHDDALQLINMYGITETTVHVTYRPLAAEDLKTAPGSVIGEAIPDLQFYILDENYQFTPVGVPGEIYVGGDGLARAYQNRPALTAERFVPNPFDNQPGTRLYKSGDLACYLPNGDVLYLGRRDHQVKIRGFRIELGEIESVLNQHGNVREAVVLVQTNEIGDKQLVAYLVPALPQQLPQTNELRDFIKGKLPEYMVPTAFVLLETLPLTPNGKLDRRALASLGSPLAPSTEAEFVAPQGIVEERVAAIWCRMLGVEKVSVYDTFFDLGGYSLLATQVIHEINEAFDVTLSLRDLFEEPTIAGLSLLIEEILIARFEESPL